MSVQLYGCTTRTNELLKEKARWELYIDAACCFQQILEVAALQHSSCTATYPPTHKPSK